MRTGVRRAVWGVGIVAAVAVVAVVGVYVAVNSGAGRQRVADRLSAVVGGPVLVERIAAGVGSTTVTVSLPGKGETPLFSGRITADVSLAGLAAGEQPRKLVVTDAAVTVRLDRDGKPLDQWPTPNGGGGDLPAVELRNATLTITQDGRPTFRVAGINATALPDGTAFGLTGTADDPAWGRWAVTGRADAAGGGITLTASEAVNVTVPLLRSIPGIPMSTWEAVQPAGLATGTIRLGYAAERITWKLDLAARDITVGIPPIGLTATGAAGGIAVDMKRVTLTDVHGRAADGTVHLKESVMDFAPDPSELRFAVAVEGADLRKLPAAWGLPAKLEGRLKGSADLTVLLKGDTVEPRGRGQGVIEGAKVAGFPAEVSLRLAGDGQRLRFDADGPMSFRPWLAPTLLAVCLVGQPAPAQPPAPPAITANLKLKDVDVAELLQKLEVKAPVALAGKVTLDVAATIPISTQPGSLRQYRVKGKLTSPALTVEGATLTDATADIQFRDGVLTLTTLSARVADGTVRGTATVGVDPPADLTADLRLDKLPLQSVLPGKLSGPVSGTAALRAPAGKYGDLSALTGDARLESQGLTVLGRAVGATTIPLAVRAGTARVTDARTVVEGLPVTLSATLALGGERAWTAKLVTQPADVVALKKLAPELTLPFDVAGKVAVTADAAGTATPFAYRVTGRADATDVAVGDMRFGTLAFDWAADRDALRVRSLAARVYDGSVRGEVTVPFGGAAGDFRAELRDIDAARLSRDVPSLPVKLAGRVSGTVTGGLPAGDAPPPPISLDVTAPRLTVQGIPATRLKGSAKYQPGQFAYDLQGESLGGTFDLNGTYPLPGKAAPPAGPGAALPPAGGTFTVRNARLGRLARELGIDALDPLRGRVDVTLTYRHPPAGGPPTGSGRVQIQGLTWGANARRSDLSAPLTLTAAGLDIPDVVGEFAGGSVRGRVRVRTGRVERGFFSLTVERADAATLLDPFGVTGATGSASVVVRGTFGREGVQGSGTVSADRLSVASVTVGDLRLPFDYALGVVGGELTVRDASATVATGRANGTARYTWGSGSRLEGNVRFQDVSVRQLGGAAGGTNLGRATGRFDFSGDAVNSLDDVSGQLVARFGETTLFDTQLFQVLAPYLLPVGGFSTSFTAGDLHARLARGSFRLERLSLTGPSLRLFADGRVGLNGRLDLEVVARTKQLGLDTGILRIFQTRIPVLGPLPLTLIADVSRVLSNRTVRLHVGGTVAQPVVQVNAAALLTEEAVRYFLGTVDPLLTELPAP